MVRRRSVYRRVKAPDHPRASKGYVLEHILVVEAALGHLLPLFAVTHHVDENSLNNRRSNLCVLQDQAEHRELHTKLRVLRAGGDPWKDRICSCCKAVKALDQFYPGNYGYFRSECKDCSKGRLRNYTKDKREAAKSEAA